MTYGLEKYIMPFGVSPSVECFKSKARVKWFVVFSTHDLVQVMAGRV